uniref:Uncharacterized protein n=1 Tax=Sphaerodactylus townsendi TaxID=933632 RepID=A0ACB8E6F0_9SAUR
METHKETRSKARSCPETVSAQKTCAILQKGHYRFFGEKPAPTPPKKIPFQQKGHELRVGLPHMGLEIPGDFGSAGVGFLQGTASVDLTSKAAIFSMFWNVLLYLSNPLMLFC